MTSTPKIKGFSDRDFNPTMSDELAFGSILDIHSLFRKFRAESPVVEQEYRTLFGGNADPNMATRRHFTVFSHRDANAVMADSTSFSSEDAHQGTEKAFGRMLVSMDAPDHTRYRKILQTAFSPKFVKSWTEEIVRPCVEKLIDNFASRGRAELISEFAIKYPFHVVYELLGLPKDDVETFHKLAFVQTMYSVFESESQEAKRNLGEYLDALLTLRSENPGQDLISQIACAEVEGEKIPREIAVSILRHLLNAAADTTYRSTGSLLVGLLSNPEQLSIVAANRDLVPAAIEEGLRWDGPITCSFRSNSREIELSGIKIPANSIVHAVLGSANRDESVYETPDRFDVNRRRGPAMPFGAGPHICIGMFLAKAEMKVALNALLDRLPNLRLDAAYPPPAVKGFMFRSPPELRVLFDAI